AVDRNRPGLLVLGLLLFDPDLAGIEIDLRPLDFAQFAESHAGMVGDYERGSQAGRERYSLCSKKPWRTLSSFSFGMNGARARSGGSASFVAIEKPRRIIDVSRLMVASSAPSALRPEMYFLI
ncbi:MAG TPA: hypothetical protein VGY91_15775, partial [Chthoniobacterales bacterium]|nr:hypothetical protein [Chthoniobacterales bacterium]